MKALFVTGGDFAALHFEDQFHGKPVKGLIDFIERTRSEADMNEEAEEITLEVVETGVVSPIFVEYIRSMRDYDDTKQSNFYLENEVIGQ